MKKEKSTQKESLNDSLEKYDIKPVEISAKAIKNNPSALIEVLNAEVENLRQIVQNIAEELVRVRKDVNEIKDQIKIKTAAELLEQEKQQQPKRKKCWFKEIPKTYKHRCGQIVHWGFCETHNKNCTTNIDRFWHRCPERR